MIGKIKWFNKTCGYGYIQGYDDTTYYFQLNSVSCDIKDIKKDIEVKFIPNYGNIDFAMDVILFKNDSDF